MAGHQRIQWTYLTSWRDRCASLTNRNALRWPYFLLCERGSGRLDEGGWFPVWGSTSNIQTLGNLLSLGKLEMHRILFKIKVVKVTTFKGETKETLEHPSLRV